MYAEHIAIYNNISMSSMIYAPARKPLNPLEMHALLVACNALVTFRYNFIPILCLIYS
jgi:hypothetical protein